jgi:hypothetical protein
MDRIAFRPVGVKEGQPSLAEMKEGISGESIFWFWVLDRWFQTLAGWRNRWESHKTGRKSAGWRQGVLTLCFFREFSAAKNGRLIF